MTSAPCFNPFDAIKKTFMQPIVLLTLALITLVLSNASYAYEPPHAYTEHFENGLSGYNVSGNVSEGDGNVTLRGGSDAYIMREIDLTGFENVFMQADVTPYGLDYGESFNVSFSVDGINFVEIFNSRDSGSIYATFPAWVDNQTIFLRIALDASSYFERLTIENYFVRGDTSWVEPSNPIPPVSSVDTLGPYATTQFTSGPNNTTVITLPTNLGENNVKHPIFVWGPATGQNPEADTALLEHIASHGFVVLSHYSSGNGSEMIDALDWIKAENGVAESLFYNHLNLDQIAAGGHSRGARSAFGAVENYSIQTSIHVNGASNIFSAGPEDLYNPALFIAAENDTYTTQDMQEDYDDSQVPSVLNTIENADANSVNQAGLGMITAWLRWHLAGEAERRDQFIGNNCEYCQTPFYAQSKFW